MIPNNNFLGNYDPLKQNWNSGIVDTRTHMAMKESGRFPEYAVPPSDVATSYPNAIGPYSGNSVSVSTQETIPNGVFVTNDGVYMFVTGTNQDRVNRFTMSTPFDLNTATADDSFAFGTTVVDPTSLSFSSNGLKLLVLGSASDTIYSYTLSTPWQVSTAVYDSLSFSVTTQEATPTGLYVKPDGTKFWIIGATNDIIYEYSMSTAWNISTASYTTVSLSSTTQDATPASISWNSTGTQFYVLGRVRSSILVFSAATAWTVAGATYSGHFANATSLSSLDDFLPVGQALTSIRSAYLVPGTRYVYAIGIGSPRVARFETFTADTLSIERNAGYLTNDQSLTGLPGTGKGFDFKPDGTRFWVGDSSTIIREYTCSSPWTITGATLVASHLRMPIDSATSVNTTGLGDFKFSADGLWFYQTPYNTAYYSQWALLKPWDLSSALYMKFGSSTILLGTGTKLVFSKNGQYVFYRGSSGSNTFYRKELTTPWELATAVNATTVNLSTLLSTGYPNGGIAITEDGKYLYTVTNTVNTRIFKFEMTTPFDITTLTLRSTAAVEFTSPNPYNLVIDRTGQTIFLSDFTNNAIYRFRTT